MSQPLGPTEYRAQWPIGRVFAPNTAQLVNFRWWGFDVSRATEAEEAAWRLSGGK